MAKQPLNGKQKLWGIPALSAFLASDACVPECSALDQQGQPEEDARSGWAGPSNLPTDLDLWRHVDTVNQGGDSLLLPGLGQPTPGRRDAALSSVGETEAGGLPGTCQCCTAHWVEPPGRPGFLPPSPGAPPLPSLLKLPPCSGHLDNSTPAAPGQGSGAW